MKFIESHPDLPEKLVNYVTEGNAVFLCGAGVSKRAGLPLFDELTERIYRENREVIKDNFVENLAFKNREYDRVLGLFEKRSHSLTSPSIVRKSVAKILTENKTPCLKSHKLLLNLSRDKNKKTRILTTNFDTLFERAAIDMGIDVKSYAVKEIPKPGGDRDHGILHIHGRIADKTAKLSDSELILTSSDFGDAYLRDGWLSLYIEDRMRLTPLVLVGYQAEDAAMRLLLETINADRFRFKDLKEIYSLDSIEMSNYNVEEATAIWKSKGIEPVIFEKFSHIYETLEIWNEFNADPISYGRKRIQEIFSV